MATDLTKVMLSAALLSSVLVGCGTMKDKTAPCKRPAGLASYADDPRLECGPMHLVNDPAAAFAAIGIQD